MREGKTCSVLRDLFGTVLAYFDYFFAESFKYLLYFLLPFTFPLRFYCL